MGVERDLFDAPAGSKDPVFLLESGVSSLTPALMWESSCNAKTAEAISLLALLKYPFYLLFILDNGMNLISKSLTVLTPA